jgi:hypothetical protein
MTTAFRTGVLPLAFAAAVLAAPVQARAEIINGYKMVLTIGGAEALNIHGGGPNQSVQSSGSRVQSGVTAGLSVAANQFTAAKVDLSGNNSANATAEASSAWSFSLAGPANANVKGGKLVLHGQLAGSVEGSGSLHMVASLQLDGGGDGSGSATIDAPGAPNVQFDVTSDIAPFAGPGDLKGRVRVHVDASATLPGGAAPAAKAEATNASRITGFRVLNSAGQQVSGFTMTADGGNIPEITGVGPTPPPVGAGTAIEYFNAGFGHYFVTANASEIEKLDNGTFVGWARTGQSFKVNTAAGTGLVPVCRFFTVAFPPTSSHFYAPRGLGCEETLALANWQFEGEVFFVALPSGAGVCPAQTVPVFRLYNNGKGGAPNHRFTTDTATRQAMIDQGWIPEGLGTGVGFCTPQ